MSLTEDFRQTLVKRVPRDLPFAHAMLGAATTPFPNDKPELSRVILPVMASARRGLEELLYARADPPSRLQMTRSVNGKSNMVHIAPIYGAVSSKMKIAPQARTVASRDV